MVARRKSGAWRRRVMGLRRTRSRDRRRGGIGVLKRFRSSSRTPGRAGSGATHHRLRTPARRFLRSRRARVRRRLRNPGGRAPPAHTRWAEGRAHGRSYLVGKALRSHFHTSIADLAFPARPRVSGKPANELTSLAKPGPTEMILREQTEAGV